MIRVLQILGVGVLLAAGGICGLAGSLWRREDPALDEIRRRPSAIAVFQATGRRSGDRSAERSPLIVQAEAFALLLNPPKGPEKPAAAALTVSPKPALPPVRPLAPAVNFKLRGTTFYPHQPERSMALIAEAGAAEGSERWVREGTQVGHFVVVNIRGGSITYRDGEQARASLPDAATLGPSSSTAPWGRSCRANAADCGSRSYRWSDGP